MAKATLNQRIQTIPLPPRLLKMRLSDEGYPVPWFVAWVDGKPDFRAIDTPKIREAHVHKKCWLCGEKLGRYLAFVIGPMCMINKINSEPPSHLDCARYAVQACPFLTQPRMRRNEKDLPEDRVEAPGFGLKRNPGAVVIWVTTSYRLERAHAGNAGVLFHLGPPVAVEFWANGRSASRPEVLASIESGMPLLQEQAKGPEAVAALMRMHDEALKLLPRSREVVS